MIAAVALAASMLMRQDTVRLRTVLPNGAIVFVERIPGAKIVSLDLFIGAKGFEETPETHGYRHLLEHLVARSIPKLDLELETMGAMLNPSTGRDWMRFNWFGPGVAGDYFLKCLKETLAPKKFSDEVIKREAKVIRHEANLQTDRERLSSMAWRKAYGDGGLDPLGDPELLFKVAPETLEKEWADLTVGSNLVISVAGDVNVELLTQTISGLLAKVPGGNTRPSTMRAVAGVSGGNDAVFVMVDGVDKGPTLAALGLSLLCGVSVPETQVTYSPSAKPGLILLSNVGNGEQVVKFFSRGDLNAMLPRVKSLLKAWVNRTGANVPALTELRGQLFTLNFSFTPPNLLEAIEVLSQKDFEEGISKVRAAGGVNL